jgi:hypothetical protein
MQGRHALAHAVERHLSDAGTAFLDGPANQADLLRGEKHRDFGRVSKIARIRLVVVRDQPGVVAERGRGQQLDERVLIADWRPGLLYGHPARCQRAGLVGRQHRDRAEGFDRR